MNSLEESVGVGLFSLALNPYRKRSYWHNSRDVVAVICRLSRSADWPEGISTGFPLWRTGFNSAVKLPLDQADKDVDGW